MNAYKDVLLDKDGNEFYPKTRTDNVYTPDGERLDNVLEDMGKFNFGSQTDVIAETTSHGYFVAPQDGYIRVSTDGAVGSWVMVVIDDITMCILRVHTLNTSQYNTLFVKKGMKINISAYGSMNTGIYIPFV